MRFNIKEEFILLTLRQNKSRIHASDLNFKLGLSTAFLLDMMQDNLISMDEDSKIVEIINTDSNNSIVSNILGLINGIQELKVWLELTLDFTNEIMSETLAGLLEREIIIKENVKRFIFFGYTKYRIKEPTLLDKMILEINQFFKNEIPSAQNYLYLTSLLIACNYNQILDNNIKFDEMRIQNDCCCSEIIKIIPEIRSEINDYYRYYSMVNLYTGL